MKKIIIFLLVVILISVITILILTVLSTQKKTQQNISKSLQEGFGHYGSEVSLGCYSSSGKCTDQGIETTTQDCNPHPDTGRGCIDENGAQTYNTVVKTKPCEVQCVSSKFSVQDGVGLTNITPGLEPGVKSLGCNTIIDSKLGINYTDYFLGDFNSTDNTYPLKECIPREQFQGYYQRALTCESHDSKGPDSCQIICGNDQNIVNLTGLTSAKLNKQLLNYFPQEYNEEGEIRNVCYDINNVDQIEILNYPGTIPKDFVYPNKCYKHVNVLDFNENLWPTSGTSNIFSLNYYQTKYNVSYIDINGDNLTQFNNYITPVVDGIISGDYDLNKNQNSYAKVRVGENIVLVDKIFETTNTGIGKDNSNLISDIFYLAVNLGSSFQKLTNWSWDGINVVPYPYPGEYPSDGQVWTTEFYNSTGNPNISNSLTQYYTSNNKDVVKYIIKDDPYVYYPIDLSEFFNESYNDITSSVSGNSTLITGITPTVFPFYCYMINRDPETGIRQHVFREGTSANPAGIGTVYLFEDFLFDSYNPVIEKVYLLKSNFAVNSSYNSDILIYSFSGDNVSITTSVDFSKSFITNNVFLNSFGSSFAEYPSVELKQNVSYNGPYSVLGTPMINNTPAFYYPLYTTLINTTDYIYTSFAEFPGVSFYVDKNIKDTKNSYFRPLYYGTSTLRFFNEETLFSSQSYDNSYITIDEDKKYFISDLSLINKGTSYEANKFYYLYSDIQDSNYQLNSSISTITPIKTPQFSALRDSTTSSQDNKIIRIVRGNEKHVVNAQLNREPSQPNKKKVSEYFQMIKNQSFTTGTSVNIIFEPEKHLTKTADYEVFKSPYIYNQVNGSKIFLCYNETGRALEKGTKIDIGTGGSKVFVNLRCPTDNVKYEVGKGVCTTCGFTGVENKITGNLDYCIQNRDDIERNFLNSSEGCIISNIPDEYNTLNNQYAKGLSLLNITKSSNYNKPPDSSVLTFPSFFTKKHSPPKIYQPKEEFFTEKLSNNYYLSIVDNNINFVDNLASWRRIFPQEVNSFSNPFQYFFNAFPKNFIQDNSLEGLGKFGTSTLTGEVSESANLNVSYNTVSSGIKSQNYLNQGITFYHGNTKRSLEFVTENGITGEGATSNYQVGMNKSYIGNLRLSNNRIFWDSSDFTSNPQYSALKKRSGSVGFIQESSPNFCNFDIIETDKYYFSCKFYDSNFNVPWNQNPSSGDFFSPDMTFFNSFIYSYIFSNGIQTLNDINYQLYGIIGTEQVKDIPSSTAEGSWNVLEKLMLFSENSENYVFDSSGGNILEIGVSAPYNVPEESDYLLYIPYEPFTVKTTFPQRGEGIEGSVDINISFPEDTFPISYPTLQIKRISELNPTLDSTGKISGYNVILDEKNYSYSSVDITVESIPEDVKVVIMNLGKGTGSGNMIDRTFKIETLAEEEVVRRETGNTGYSFFKKYIEFFFSIDSLSQSDMKQLYTLNQTRKINFTEAKTDVDTTYGFDGKPCSDATTRCFGPGCMPGDAPPAAQCFQYLESGGYYDISCPNPKWWYCPDNRTEAEKNVISNVNQFFLESLNPLTPALSARYIKSSFQSPHQKIDNGKFACLTNSEDQDILKSKTISQSTRITKYKNNYYINEFRENIDFFTKTQERTFSIGDTFDYYNSNNGPETFSINREVFSGNKNYSKVLSLRVLEVGVALEIGTSIVDIFDYKCESTVSGVSENPFINNIYKGGIGVGAQNTLQNNNNTTVIGIVNSKSFFIYLSASPTPKPLEYQSTIYNTPFVQELDFDYQLPYTVKDKDGVVRTRAVCLGINDDMTINFGSPIRYSDGPAPPPAIPVNFTQSGDSVYFDSYKFDKDYITDTSFEEPRYGIKQSGAAPNIFPPLFYPVYNNLAGEGDSIYNQAGAVNSLALSTVYSGEAIRAGILDTMVLTGTTLTSTEGQTTFVNLNVSGKPYGSETFFSQPENINTVINSDSLNRIENFALDIVNFPLGTVLRSKKGFNIQFTSTQPCEYAFNTSESPSGEITPFKSNYTYSSGDIVNFKNKNLRQYFRNNSGYAVPYMKTPDVNNGSIPYSVSDQGKWYYPVFLKSSGTRTSTITLSGRGTFYYNPNDFVTESSTKNNSNFLDFSMTTQEKIDVLNSFNIVSKTVYPQDIFVSYSSKSYYALGEIVSSSDGDQIVLYKSLKARNIGNPVSDTYWWSMVSLTQNLTSYDKNQFYDDIAEGNDFAEYIEKIKYLDNQNLPALVRNLSNQEEKCPELCTLANVDETYKNTFLDTEYFDDIKYLFLNPVILSQTSTDKIVSLANAPVPQSKYYNTSFLEDGGARKDFLSQYMYFIDIEGQENKFDKPDCSGNLFITNSTGPSINTEVNKFNFANSILFNFIPCDIDSQDFIKYKVKSDASSGTTIVVDALDYPSTNTPNIFPPTSTDYNFIVSSKNGTCFQKIQGQFNYTHLNSGDTSESEFDITKGGLSIRVFNIERSNTLVTHTSPITGTAQYGDIWYDYVTDSGPSYPFGFVIPESSGVIGARSFMQLNRNYNFTQSGDVSFIPSRNVTGVNTGEHEINSFDISFDSSLTFTDGFYFSDDGTSFYIKTYNNLPLQQTEAVFTPSTALDNAEYIYLPTYDINSNIKAKAVCVFGEDYIANMKYTLDKKDSVLSLDNKLLSTVVFDEFRNDLLLNNEQKKKGELFLGVSSKSIDNLQDTFIINFNSETFSIQPNLFEKPITSADNKLLYNKETTVSGSNSLGCVDTSSTSSFISRGMFSMKGTSVLLDFSDFAKFNTAYSTSGPSIPGRTNIQVQFSEIRQNRSNDYIQENNRCSVYFEPIVGSNKVRIITSVWKILFSPDKYNLYTGTLKKGNLGPRFYGNKTFEKSDTTINIYLIETVHLGCNLLYKFDQSDKSNLSPVVFSNQKYSDTIPFSKTDIIIGSPGNQKFVIEYYLQGEIVSYDNYSSKFNTTTDRYIEISYQSDFDNNDFTDAKIYYGIPTSPYYQTGGMIKFDYH